MTRRHQASSKHKDISQDTLGARYTLFISHSDFLSAGGQTSCSTKDGSTGIRGQELYLIKLPSLYCHPLYSLASTMLNLFLHQCKAIGGPHLQPCQQDFRENSKRPRHNRSLWDKCFSRLWKWTVFNFSLQFFPSAVVSIISSPSHGDHEQNCVKQLYRCECLTVSANVPVCCIAAGFSQFSLSTT